MKALSAWRVLCLLIVSGIAVCCSASGQRSRGSAATEDHTKWVADCLREIQTISAGTTRNQVLRVFTTEGGLSSRLWRTYVYRKCRYIKVDLEFKPVGNQGDMLDERPEDIVAKISRPYLQWPVMD